MTDIHDDTLVLTDELGNEITAKIILTFESEEFNKSYVVYQLDDEDEEEYHAASFNPEDGDEGTLGQIETDEEWDLIEEVLESFLEEDEEEQE
ncbi:MAG: DUF1292 domain-containing protein [Candidatus Izemoplasmatales bacterium]|uniref:DUF1292 domain-containing protein n=1 Tax=Hujiaoplasma nucleasis TaxID=2725268 RepID=A0A7L6N4M0_9MOLU|nr:DUF1292 domain-containing protein [Hujiaoplasma nucleasis]QLY39454.1 DUF1292 domain-containing protein [Hujiaoplasma nucleasis]